MSKQSLSKGTLGLKFMNRTVPPSSPATATTSQNPSTATPSRTSATAPSERPDTSKLNQEVLLRSNEPSPSANPSLSSSPPSVPLSRSELTTRISHVNNLGTTTTTTTTKIFHDSSLLSFPILSKPTMTPSASSSSKLRVTSSTSQASPQFTNSNLYYNSMPLTSSTISGRRSFGGANVEIEKLNDPNSHLPPPSTKGDEKRQQNDKKKSNKKLQRQNDIVSTRRTDSKTKTTTTMTAKRPSEEEPRMKKRRVSNELKRGHGDGLSSDVELTTTWEGGEDQVQFPRGSKSTSSKTSTASGGGGGGGGFKKPSGFEGAKGQPRREGGRGGRGTNREGLMELDQHQWPKRGETREWDRDKPARGEEEEYELGDEESERRFLDGLDEDESEDEFESDESSGSSEDDEEEIRNMLISAKALDKKRSTPKQSKEKKELIEKEIRKYEENNMVQEGSGPRRKGPGGKKGRKH